MKKLLLTLGFAVAALALSAQENEALTLRLEARLDYQQEYLEGSKIGGNSGFMGKYLNLRMDGNLGAGFSYSYRQRLNKMHSSASFFDATDWIHVSYSFKNWSISAGKQVVAIGGYEYDSAPIDLYFCSEFWNNIACYQLGASVAYTTKNGNDKILFQFCQSPFRTNSLNSENKEMFAYNLMSMSSYGFYNSLWSWNAMEYLPGKYIYYFSIGNRFTFDKFSFDLDLMDRALILKDSKRDKQMSLSAMLQINWDPLENLRFFVKATGDYNNYREAGDWCVTPGTSIYRIGGGLEYYPIKDLRLHLNYCYTDGKNGSATGALQARQNIIDLGVTWKMNVLKIKK